MISGHGRNKKKHWSTQASNNNFVFPIPFFGCVCLCVYVYVFVFVFVLCVRLFLCVIFCCCNI